MDTPLDKFRKGYNSTKVTQYDHYLVYKVKMGQAHIWAEDANKVIEVLRLPLVAIPSRIYPRDTFIVKSNDISL